MMKAISRAATAAALSLCVSSLVFGQDFFYPPKGRNETQQRQDRFECHEWAVAQSRFDPVEFAARAATPATVATTPAAATEVPGHAGRAVIGGAAVGAAIGEVADNDAGKGAMVGGAAGLLRARMADKKAAAERASTQAQKQMAAQQAQTKQSQDVGAARDAYGRARAACFKGRGYTVS
jgi:hypothetical protein